jgi:sortase (surface protein transpeptidase)
MAAGSPRHRWRRSPAIIWWAVSSVLLLVSAVCLTVGLRSHQVVLAGPVSPQITLPSPVAVSAPAHSSKARPKAMLAVARSTPVALDIPAIGVNVPLSGLGLNPNGTVQVPTNFQEPGWYELGPSPGQLGSAVILGHVDSYLGPAVFFELRTLRAGDQVNVKLADGLVLHFRVLQVAMYLKVQFPSLKVYGSHGFSALQLVTCGGAFDSQTGHYLSNIVVYTALTGLTPVARA